MQAKEEMRTAKEAKGEVRKKREGGDDNMRTKRRADWETLQTAVEKPSDMESGSATIPLSVMETVGGVKRESNRKYEVMPSDPRLCPNPCLYGCVFLAEC